MRTYRSIFQIPPTVYGPVTQPIVNASGEIVDPGGKVITTERVESPTYGMLNRTGYTRHTVTNIVSQFGLDLDMGFLTKGLNLTGTLAYQTNSVGSLSTKQDYERWVQTGDSALTFIKKGSAEQHAACLFQVTFLLLSFDLQHCHELQA